MTDIKDKLWDGSFRVHKLVRHDDVVYELNKPLEYSAKCVRLAKDTGDWQDKADRWLITINSEAFDYYTGIGLRKSGKPVKPELSMVLSALELDSEAGRSTFEDWCWHYGYDNDSIKAFESYRGCQKTCNKLDKAGVHFTDELREFLHEY